MIYKRLLKGRDKSKLPPAEKGRLEKHIGMYAPLVSRYVMDYMGSCVKQNYGAQGYASNFCLSIMDRDWGEGMNEDQAVKVVEHCIQELKMRFLINQSNFIIKVIDKEGVRTLKFDADPADN